MTCNMPAKPKLNTLLEDIHKFIEPNSENLLKQNVIMEVLKQLQDKMKAVDEYYNVHCREITGSDCDLPNLKEPDEFRVRFVMDTMSSSSGENLSVVTPTDDDYPGCVKLSIFKSVQGFYTKIDLNNTLYQWRSSNNQGGYVDHYKFLQWFESMVGKALKEFKVFQDLPVCVIDGVAYKIRQPIACESPMLVESDGFRVKITLLPVLLFSDYQWINREGYRAIPAGCSRDYIMVESERQGNVKFECHFGKLSMQDQEEQMLNNAKHLRQTIQLVRLLSSTQRINIPDYCIRTLALWEINHKKNTEPSFWEHNDLATTFEYILLKFYEALDRGSLTYFWNNKINMIRQLDTIDGDKYKIIALLNLLQDDPIDYRTVERYFLTFEKYQEYLEFYQK